MPRPHMERISVAVVVVLVLGIGLFLQSNRENIAGNTANAFATAGSASLCPIIQVVYGQGAAQEGAAAARANAIKACREAATAIPCPAQCPSSSVTSEPVIIKEEHVPNSDWWHAWARCTRVCGWSWDIPETPTPRDFFD